MIRFCPALLLATPALHAAEPHAAKSRIKVGLSKLSQMLYPARPDFALVTFEQDYPSSTLSDRTPQRQFRNRENGRWKIIHETSI